MILHIICIGHCTACIYAIDYTVYRGSVYLGDQVLDGGGSLRQSNSLNSSGSDLKDYLISQGMPPGHLPKRLSYGKSEFSETVGER